MFLFFINQLLHLFGDVVDGLSKVLDVVGGDTSNGDTTITGEVDMPVITELVNLLRLQTSVTEHTDLVGDVAPVDLGTKVVFKVVSQLMSHVNDTISHGLDFTEPFLLQFGSVQNSADETGTVDGRVGVHGANQNLDLRVDTSLFLSVTANNRESTNTFTIETHVLGEGLREDNGVVAINELAKGISIASAVTRSETLIGHVEEREVLAFLCVTSPD
jgi:hypothetical protein